MLAELLPMQRYKKFRYNIVEFDYLNDSTSKYFLYKYK